MARTRGGGADTVRSDENGLIAVLAFGGVVMSLSQTLVIPLLGMLPAILNTSAVNASWVVTITLLAGAVAGAVTAAVSATAVAARNAPTETVGRRVIRRVEPVVSTRSSSHRGQQ